MGGPYGLQPTGFVIKPYEDIQSDFEASFRATFNNGINTEPQSNIGMTIGIMSDRISEAWEVLEAIDAALDPDAAADQQQDEVCALTGTVRNPPKLTHVYATLTGAAGTLINAGKQASIAGTGVKFELLNDATIGGAGTVAGVEMVAVDAGPSPAFAGTLTVIETPVAGWTGITNPADHFVLGANIEADPDLRVRREAELRAPGNAAGPAIQAKVEKVAGVTACVVLENDTDAADGNGLPPHSVRVIVNGGADADIQQAIYKSKGAGTNTVGAVTTNVLDSWNQPHPINFDRATDLDIYVIVNVKIDAGTYPTDGDAQIQDAIAAFGLASLTIASSVVASRLGALAFSVSGVTDVPSVYIGTAPAPAGSATITSTITQRPNLDTSRIVVNHV